MSFTFCYFQQRLPWNRPVAEARCGAACTPAAAAHSRRSGACTRCREACSRLENSTQLTVCSCYLEHSWNAARMTFTNFIAKMALRRRNAAGPACIALNWTVRYSAMSRGFNQLQGVFFTAACVTFSSMAVSIFSSLIFSMIISFMAILFVAFIVITVCHWLYWPFPWACLVGWSRPATSRHTNGLVDSLQCSLVVSVQSGLVDCVLKHHIALQTIHQTALHTVQQTRLNTNN